MPQKLEQSEHDSMEEIKRALWKCVASIERLENLLTNNEMNNGRGLVAQVQEQGKRLSDVETFVKVYEAHKELQEKETNKAIAKMGVWAAVAGVVISAALSIVFFLLTKK